MRVLTKENIKECNDIKKEFVAIPEWTNEGEEEAGVFVKVMGADERDSWEYETFVKGNEGKLASKNKEQIIQGSMKRIRSSLVAICSVNENGERIFTEEDIEWLGKKNAKAVDRIYEVAQRINGMRKEDIEGEIKN
ncbi:MAG: hypothetical protein M0P71_12235 [Melioribacteraceae bacterium]|jgi:hypothetical protein|nr:hypothetical protein [Melioribacteraceae bacterium]